MLLCRATHAAHEVQLHASCRSQCDRSEATSLAHAGNGLLNSSEPRWSIVGFLKREVRMHHHDGIASVLFTTPPFHHEPWTPDREALGLASLGCFDRSKKIHRTGRSSCDPHILSFDQITADKELPQAAELVLQGRQRPSTHLSWDAARVPDIGWKLDDSTVCYTNSKDATTSQGPTSDICRMPLAYSCKDNK